MTSIKLLEKINISLIKEQEVSTENENITYRLYCIEFIEATKYAIGADFRNENEICFVGGDLSNANELYEIICRNSVTPCTLAYIIEDHFKEKY